MEWCKNVICLQRKLFRSALAETATGVFLGNAAIKIWWNKILKNVNKS